jgi:hypothetical protein
MGKTPQALFWYETKRRKGDVAGSPDEWSKIRVLGNKREILRLTGRLDWSPCPLKTLRNPLMWCNLLVIGGFYLG